MVERVSKPEAPPPYQILPTKEAKDDKSRREQERESEEKYQKSKGRGEWAKFSGRAMTIRPAKVQRDRIDRVLFRNALLKGGICILDSVIVWKDGRRTEPALFLLHRREDFMRIRTFAKGQIVPENFWAAGPEIEIGIVQAESSSGSWSIQEVEKEEKKTAAAAAKKFSLPAKMGLVNKATGNFNWMAFLLYVTGFIIAALIIYSAAR
jgi:hypothetical protein